MGIADTIRMPGLNPSQISMARIIETEFARAGFGPEVIGAAIANAFRESGLNPKARSKPPEDSVGLFQLNIKGAGKGMSRAQREDPTTNARVIAREAKAASKFMAAVKAGEKDVRRLAALFSTYVERPAAKATEEAIRAGYASQMFPHLVPSLAASVLTSIPPVGPAVAQTVTALTRPSTAMRPTGRTPVQSLPSLLWSSTRQVLGKVPRKVWIWGTVGVLILGGGWLGIRALRRR